MYTEHCQLFPVSLYCIQQPERNSTQRGWVAQPEYTVIRWQNSGVPVRQVTVGHPSQLLVVALASNYRYPSCASSVHSAHAVWHLHTLGVQMQTPHNINALAVSARRRKWGGGATLAWRVGCWRSHQGPVLVIMPGRMQAPRLLEPHSLHAKVLGNRPAQAAEQSGGCKGCKAYALSMQTLGSNQATPSHKLPQSSFPHRDHSAVRHWDMSWPEPLATHHGATLPPYFVVCLAIYQS